MRLITVVMNEPSSEVRSKETSSMLDYGFNTYEVNKLLTKDSVVGSIKVSLGTKKSVDIVPIDDIDILHSKIDDKKDITYKVITNNAKAPVKKGDDVGDIIVYEDGIEIMQIDVTVINDVNKVNIFVACLRNIVNIISGKSF
jgi:serine-type D-Ala-D-Ala carboxypeptidase (penicillin-binding protein 5/6)